MRKLNDTILLSASDLMRFAGCKHATKLDLDYLEGLPLQPQADSEDAALLQKQGDDHERRHLESLKVARKSVVEMTRRDLVQDANETRKAMQSGPDVIFQGALLGQHWGGWSDFLERVDKASALGNFSYEVVDTKLKRKPHPKHVLQLVLYSDLLTEIQETQPEFAHIELGNGTRASLRLEDYASYARQARQRLEAFLTNPTVTRPIPCEACSLCRWRDHCTQEWEAQDSLFGVAGISRQQVKKLEDAGVNTMAGLANREDRVPKLSIETFARLRTQARLQVGRRSGPPTFILRELAPGKGFNILPASSKGDVFYDIEGDPHVEGGLEYLHGIWADGHFKAFWAHDHKAEAIALQELLEFFRTRLRQYPDARIYHYAPYEVTALRRLTAKYGIGEAFLDQLLREQRFVDLYAVVRGGLICSEKNYSIKSLEAFYGLERKGEVKTAGGSVVAYEQWLETGDPHILDEIENYNRIDCISTEMLRDWLLAIKPATANAPILEEQQNDTAVPDKTELRTSDLQRRLAASGLPQDRQEHLFNLAFFHNREAKPGWWAVFDSLSRDDEDLIDDLDALGGLRAISAVEPEKKSFKRCYSYPEQETKFRSGQDCSIPADAGFVKASVLSVDRKARTICVKIGPGKQHLLTDHLSIHPAGPLATTVLEEAVADVVADNAGPASYQAIDDLLNLRAPRLRELNLASLDIGRNPVEAMVRAVKAMENTVLPVQGPPGTGKTYVTARAILALLQDGFRVGVASGSHEAIRNVFEGASTAMREADLGYAIVHKLGPGEDPYGEEEHRIVRTTSNSDPYLQNAPLVGGTAFFFARQENRQAFDWLFVDEAGQVSLANLLAMGRAARNIVLVGDPQQLPQVIQGTHPYPAGLSCLEWIMEGHSTIPRERGLFLEVTRRLHPEVCSYISDIAYEGRLHSSPDTELQKIDASLLPSSGAWFVPVEHTGNAQKAEEEVAMIQAVIQKLLAGRWTEKTGEARPLNESDIIVVAPYNLQVQALRAALPQGIRVGTVDKFQGQEAPVCLVSMTASSAEETPRGLEFLFSLNRINVAVSRAKALALVFGSPKLREAPCRTIAQMRLINVLCKLPIFKVHQSTLKQ